MNCPRCGTPATEGSAYCLHCGLPRIAATGVQTGTAAEPMGRQTEPNAAASMVLGVLGLTIVPILAGVAAIVLGHKARRRIAESAGRLTGSGLALAGLIMGYISVVAIPLVLIAFFFIGVSLSSGIQPGRSTGFPSTGNEGLAEMRQLVIAMETYFAQYPQIGYPAELRHLGGNEPKNDLEAGMIDDVVAAGGPKGGHVFYYEAIDNDGDGFIEDYFLRVDPEKADGPSYCSDRNAIIRVNHDGPCTLESRPVR